MGNITINQAKGRVLFLISASLLLAGYIIPGNIITDLQKQNVKGKVKSILEIRQGNTNSEDSSASAGVTYEKLSRYNIDGFEVETSILNNLGRTSTVSHLFDTAGYKIGLREYTQDGTLWLTVTYKLDENGSRLEAVYDWMGKGGFDEMREKSEQLYEVLDRNAWDKVLYKNDYRGMPLEEKYLRKDGSLLFKFTYRYDVLGRKTEMNYFNSKGRTSWETKYRYDKNGNLSESTVYKSNRVAARSEYSYQFDVNGNWTNRVEVRKVNYNILTSNLVEGKFVIERNIEYFP